MSSRQNRPGGRGSGPGRSAPARPGVPAAGNPRRARQLLAVGGVGLALILAMVITVVSQSGQGGQAPATLVPDRHAIGSPQAPVTITEWSDFQ